MSWDEWKQQRAHYLEKKARISELEAENQRLRDAIDHSIRRGIQNHDTYIIQPLQQCITLKGVEG